MTARLPFDLDRIESQLGLWCETVGSVFREWRAQDSGCVALGVRIDGGDWFFKFAETAGCAAGLRSAVRFHAAVSHRAIVPLAGSRELATGPVLVYPWIEGEVLYDPAVAPGEASRNAPEAPHRRFRSLPTHRIIAALDAILDAHIAALARGFVAVDLYDGSVMYDFARGEVHLCDFDGYRPGPFRLSEDRLPGSTRFMAPEESRRGALIGEWTTVYNLGRMIEQLGGSALTPEVGAVAARATSEEPAGRYQTVAHLVGDWQAATGGRPTRASGIGRDLG